MKNLKMYALSVVFLLIGCLNLIPNSVNATPLSEPAVVAVTTVDCGLTVFEEVVLIWQASAQADIPFFISLVRYFQGTNDVMCIEGGFQVSLLELDPAHGFVIIDILDES